MPVETDFAEAASAAVHFPEQVQGAQPSEGCPTPLGWSEVLEAFRAESSVWSIEVSGASLAGRTLGKGRPLYFLNGISGSYQLFCLLAWLLRDEFRCVLFDYRSQLQNSAPGGPTRTDRPSLVQLVGDLFAVADAQNDRVFSVLAAPFGSVVALGALVEHPERIERAILLGGFAHRRLSRFERLLCLVGHYLTGPITRVPLHGTLQLASHQRGFPPFDATRWDFFAENTGQTPICDLADRAALLRTFDVRAQLKQVRQPVLLLRTEHEGAVSSAGRDELERGLPYAKSESMPLAGQLAYLTHPHRVAKAVRSFLGEASSERPASCQAIGLDNSCCADHKDESP
jgi:pimeloyl-ACP methyl ester carboxylesterase